MAGRDDDRPDRGPRLTDRSRASSSTRDVAERAFRAATAKPIAATAEGSKNPVLPQAKELVSIRLDRDVLEWFQEDGPGWQERINAALRKAAGL